MSGKKKLVLDVNHPAGKIKTTNKKLVQLSKAKLIQRMKDIQEKR